MKLGIKNKISKLTDEELVRRIKETNDTHLFAVLYDRYSNLVYSKCLSFTRSKEEAQDLTHDIFIKLYVKLRSFKGNSKFSTWLYSFTYNFCVNYVQRDSYKKNENLIMDDEDKNYNLNAEKEVDDSSIYSLKTDKLKTAMEKLEPKDKMIILMKYQDEIPIKEIKELLEIGESAVKMRLKRAKAKLIELYNDL